MEAIATTVVTSLEDIASRFAFGTILGPRIKIWENSRKIYGGYHFRIYIWFGITVEFGSLPPVMPMVLVLQPPVS